MTFWEWSEKYKMLGTLQNFNLSELDPKCIWSEIDDGFGKMLMMPGRWVVNCYEQYVTELPADVDFVLLDEEEE